MSESFILFNSPFILCSIFLTQSKKLVVLAYIMTIDET